MPLRPKSLHKVNSVKHAAQRKKPIKVPKLPTVGSAYFGPETVQKVGAMKERRMKLIAQQKAKTQNDAQKSKPTIRPNTVSPYDQFRGGSGRLVIKSQLGKNSPLKKYLHPAQGTKYESRMPIEVMGTGRFSPIIKHGIIQTYSGNKRIINLFESIVMTKSWVGMESYKQKEIMTKLDSVIQRVGEKQFTDFIKDKARRERFIEIITRDGIATKASGIEYMRHLTGAVEEIKRNSLVDPKLVKPSPDSRAAFASLKSYYRHTKKADMYRENERRKMLQSAPPKIKNILMSDLAKKLIDNKFLSYFAGNEIGRMVLVNLINNAKGREILHNFRTNRFGDYLLKYYISTPEGQKIFNHAISTRGRREFVARLTSPHHKDAKGWRAIETFLQSASQFQEAGMTQEAKEQFKKAAKLIQMSAEKSEQKR